MKNVQIEQKLKIFEKNRKKRIFEKKRDGAAPSGRDYLVNNMTVLATEQGEFDKATASVAKYQDTQKQDFANLLGVSQDIVSLHLM